MAYMCSDSPCVSFGYMHSVQPNVFIANTFNGMYETLSYLRTVPLYQPYITYKIQQRKRPRCSFEGIGRIYSSLLKVLSIVLGGYIQLLRILQVYLFRQTTPIQYSWYSIVNVQLTHFKVLEVLTSASCMYNKCF